MLFIVHTCLMYLRLVFLGRSLVGISVVARDVCLGKASPFLFSRNNLSLEDDT